MQTAEIKIIDRTDAPQRGVERLSLFQFRCYENFSVSLDPRSVVLTGLNGAGKTNLLEALSFLIPGRGLRRARLHEVKRQDSSEPWAISAHLKNHGEGLHIGTGLDPEDPETERRVTKINGDKMKNQSALAEWVSIVWLTPQMDRLFLDGPQSRRRFLDRLVYGFDAGHALRLSRYEQALKERSFLLKQGGYDRYWIESLEDVLVNDGIAITIARREVVGQLSSVLKTQDNSFLRADLSLEGDVERLLLEHSLLEVEEKMRALLTLNRDQDRLSGRASLGPHRSDLVVMYSEKKRPAAHCSTGEQKALLLSIVMASAFLLSVRKEAIPLLLLDEVVAHLDKARRSTLLDAILKLKIQAWLTGTDRSLFEELGEHAQFINLENAYIISQT